MSKTGWILTILFIWLALIGGTIWCVRFVINPKSSVFKYKNKPKNSKTIDIAVKILIGIVIITVVITSIIPIAMDIPYVIKGDEIQATATVKQVPNHRDFSKLMSQVVFVNTETGEELSVRIIADSIAVGDEAKIEYLPHSKYARIIR